MKRFALAVLPLALVAGSALAQTSSGLWNYHFQNGIGQYLTGEWDSPTGGALNLSCRRDGNVAIMAQIKGQAPRAGSILVLSTSSRAGSSDSRFATNAQGSAVVRATSPAFRRLWANLRANDIVTLRYADGRTSVQSLAGAAKLLPAKPCG
ncbi:hypothetical protein TPR58_12795 [Sphingomonas sp. HF-S3]|uniref:Uncharacterized protein n=1 Tax=Sphingomonas rustica TaxID=3103142 RepID=A0ABV0BBT7_9SPHN